jgi:hypothetical protein
MTPLLWIGLGFVAALVAFLMVTFFVTLKQDTVSATAYNNLRFLTALCGGFAGGFLAGEALIRWEQQMPGGAKLFLSGTAGFAILFLVWLTYPTRPPPAPANPLPNEYVKMNIPADLSFEQAARVIVKPTQRTISFEGFDQGQLATEMPDMEIEAPTFREALEQLRYHSNKLPGYRVLLDNGVYHVQRS